MLTFRHHEVKCRRSWQQWASWRRW